MANIPLTPEALELIAERFKVLAEPARLQILSCLRTREATVSEIVDETGLGQANVSKHLQLLHSHGFVARRREGLFAYYTIADTRVFKLCELVCDSMNAALSTRRRQLSS